MEVNQAIKTRRAYRSLNPVNITDELIKDLAENASLAPSCFNYQPWRFIFIKDPSKLEELHGALSRTNKWVHQASMIVAVFSRADDDCRIRGRDYHQFDTGMAVGFLMLRATELGLVAHPFAGFREKRAKDILEIPEEYQLIALIAVGEKAEVLHDLLTDNQKETEKGRPERKTFEEYAYINKFS